jgi:peptidyl-tRNA hydrolase, PTH2 family
MSRIEELMAMGFEENISQLAIENCGHGTVEDAINWIFNHNESGLSEIGFIETVHEDMKLVLVVRSDLQMTPGKMAAQCVHAALAVAHKVENDQPISYLTWKNEGEATICLRCASEEELNGLEAQAIASGKDLISFEPSDFIGLPTSVVHDAGRTQVAPNSRTVLAIGPATISRIDSVTGHLRLY